MSKVETAIAWMKDLAENPIHGYDQRYRWGEKGDYDCSSAVITAWQTAGVPVKTNGATYTGNMYKAFIKSGFKDVTKSITLKTGAGLKAGDVLLNTTHHTALYIGNGKVAQASINEKGTITGGTPGDQTGNETNIRSYYNYPWNVVLRYEEKESKTIMRPQDYLQAALDVINGKYGNGEQRKKNLEARGYSYSRVQKLVNHAYKGD